MLTLILNDSTNVNFFLSKRILIHRLNKMLVIKLYLHTLYEHFSANLKGYCAKWNSITFSFSFLPFSNICVHLYALYPNVHDNRTTFP